MKSKKIIGITGSIATGKSTISNYLISKGFKVIDADLITHQLMKKDQINYNLIVENFGDEILGEDLEIDRRKLANIVFSNEEKLKILNSLTHENIFHKIREIITESSEDVIFVDIALLIELLSKDIMKIKFDEIWLAYTERKKQIERLISRNNLTFEDAMKKINSQMDIEEKKKFATKIFDNNSLIENLYDQIEKELRIL